MANRPNPMSRWSEKLAVVTGASSGIGAAICIELVNAGLKVVGLARRQERVEELKSKLPANLADKLFSFKCDISKEEDIKAAFAWIESTFGGVDVLVNNAGIVRSTNLVSPDNTTAIREVLDTNVMGVVLCTREAFQSMKSRNVDGHVILINSIVGHQVPFFAGIRPSSNIYSPSKYAVTAMTEVFRQEFQSEGTKIKITVSKVLPHFKTNLFNSNDYVEY